MLPWSARRRLGVAGLQLLWSLLALACASQACRPAIPARVLIVSVDGLRADAVSSDRTPHLQLLMASGASTLHARTVLPCVTLPVHVSMLSGLEPEQHRVSWNAYRPELGPVGVPTLFSIAHRAGRRTVMIAGKPKFLHLAAPGALDVARIVPGGDPAVVEAALTEVAQGFDLLFVHLPDVDGAGHTDGWMSPSYLTRVARMDRELGRLLGALPRGVTVIVTADHGGLGITHGRDIPEDMTIPWIIAGPGVSSHRVLATPVRVVDTAATALRVLGLSTPWGIQGRAVAEAFSGS
jgi:arylsulfatase A-like enzyme